MNRRKFIALLGGAGIGLMAGRSQAEDGDPTAEIGRKFNADGTPYPFRGNTFICKVRQGPDAPYFRALRDAHTDLRNQPFFGKIAVLPLSSYHMTVFDGANDQARKPGLWPTGLPYDAPIEECDREVARRLADFPLEAALPIRMRADPTRQETFGTSLSVTLRPADEAEERKLRRLRDRLSDAVGIRAPGHDSYRFHTTLAYILRQLSAAEAEAARRAMARWAASAAEAEPVIAFDSPEFCTYDDMFAYKRVFALS